MYRSMILGWSMGILWLHSPAGTLIPVSTGQVRESALDWDLVLVYFRASAGVGTVGDTTGAAAGESFTTTTPIFRAARRSSDATSFMPRKPTTASVLRAGLLGDARQLTQPPGHTERRLTRPLAGTERLRAARLAGSLRPTGPPQCTPARTVDMLQEVAPSAQRPVSAAFMVEVSTRAVSAAFMAEVSAAFMVVDSTRAVSVAFMVVDSMAEVFMAEDTVEAGDSSQWSDVPAHAGRSAGAR
jgi:hypothetical protein